MDDPVIKLAHGGGGRMMHELIQGVFLDAFGEASLGPQHDGAVFAVKPGRLAFTTDSYVVRPLFFPGGNIGSLAVWGTVNDLAMCGARPLYLSAGFILEEGLPIETLRRIAGSMREAAAEAGVGIVTGDTKVVDRGKGDGVYLNTSGVGLVGDSVEVSPARVRDGDLVVLSGDLGRHGVAILAAREGLDFETRVPSDSADLSRVVSDLLDAGLPIHCMRDLTRGGLASALSEIAEAGDVEIAIEEERVPVLDEVRGFCEILGLDPLHVANEGRFVLFLPPESAGAALEILHRHPVGSGARIIGEVRTGEPARVSVKSAIGVPRILDMPSGEQLPRIC